MMYVLYNEHNKHIGRYNQNKYKLIVSTNVKRNQDIRNYGMKEKRTRKNK